MSEPLLKLRNHHTAACGEPPIIDGVAGEQYVGYFENKFGEQWIFMLDRESGKATLRGGDAGWNTEFDVTDGRVADLILNNEEQLWLQACWFAGSQQRAGD